MNGTHQGPGHDAAHPAGLHALGQRQDRVGLDGRLRRHAAGCDKGAVHHRAVVHLGAQQAQRMRRRLGPADLGPELQAARRRRVATDQEKVMLVVLRHHAQRCAAVVEAFGVAQAQVQCEALQPGLDLDRTHRAQHRPNADMAHAQQRGKARGHGHGRRDRTDHQIAARVLGAAEQVLLQQLMLAQHLPRAGQDALAFGREAREAAPALDHRHAEVSLQRLDCVGQGRLRHVAGQRRPAEVPVVVQSHQVFERNEEVHDRRAG